MTEGLHTETLAERALRLHREWGGKIEVTPRVAVDTREALSLAYTPGVAAPCLEIRRDPAASYALTRRHNLVAVVTDGSAVLGLGDIGPEAGMPVMEGKCVLFKAFGGVDAFPLCVNTQDVEAFVETVYRISGSFGAINLEDIAAPRCFVIERELKRRCDIPVFHDDQHGTAVTVLAGMLNALRVVGKRLEEARIVINGAGAAGVAIAHMLLDAGVGELTVCDRAGILADGAPQGLTDAQATLAALTNQSRLRGGLADALKGRTRSSAFLRRALSRPIWCVRWAATRSYSPAPTPYRRSCRTKRCAAARRWSPRAAAMRRTRSTTFLRFPASFGARWTCARATSISPCSWRRPGRWRIWSHRRRFRAATSSRNRSIRAWGRRWRRRSRRPRGTAGLRGSRRRRFSQKM